MKKTVLITGGTRGIGLELAKIFAKEKNNLILVARDEDRLIKVKNKLEKKHKVKVGTIQKNLANPKACEDIFKALEKRNIIVDILINNAGFGDHGKFIETNWKKEFDMIQTNVISLTYLSKLFAQEMSKRGGGKIMNVGSTASFQAGPMMAVYCATKAYVLSLSEAISKELENTGVTVTTLCPGVTASNFQKTANIENMKMIKGKKMATAKEVAEYGHMILMTDKNVGVHGLKNKFFVFIQRFLPRKFVTNIAYNMMEK